MAVLVAHNRRTSTLAALQHFFHQESTARLGATLVDAGSTDGTADAVAESFPDVRIIRKGEELFWSSGMRVAMATALEQAPDFLLWLNDDTYLDSGAVQRLLDVHEAEQTGRGPCIIVGAVRDPESGQPTYSGVLRSSRFRPTHFALAAPSDVVEAVDTMNGNCVLLSTSVIRRVGLIDPVYTHGMGDYDYGLRAKRAGVSVLLAPGTVGVCRRNPPRTAATSIRSEWARLQDAKNLPLHEWIHFCQRWAGIGWPIYAASPYVRRLLYLIKRPSTT